MNSETSRQAQEFSLSKVTEQSAHSKALVALGKKLVAELELSDSVDTLGRWMAHYVAELIKEAENATGDDRSNKHIQLRDAILDLWARRAVLPNRVRPFADLEPIFRALASLDPESKIPRYYSPSRAPSNESEESPETKQWIELAQALDHISKILIDYCLISAADSAVDKSKEWVKLAKKAGVDDSFEFTVIRFINGQNELMKEQDGNEYQRRILADRQKKLEAFMSLASILARDIKIRMDSLTSNDDSLDRVERPQ